MARRSLIDGHKMLCPRCKREHSVEQYLRLEEAKEFDSETTPVYKCPSCKWIFALREPIPQEVLDQLSEVFDELRAKLAQQEGIQQP